MVLYCNGMTSEGNRDGENQDCLGMFTDGSRGIFIVADGMGGHTKGEVASRYVTFAVKEFWDRWSLNVDKWDWKKLNQKVYDMVLRANEYIFHSFNQSSVCGTTIAILVIDQEQYAIYSVGDSRVYALQDEELWQMTHDDIWDTLQETQLKFTRQECLNHPNHNKLTQAVGTQKALEVHFLSGKINPMQTFALVTDGVYQFCEEDTIKELLHRSKKAEQQIPAIETVVEEVFWEGAKDNLTCMVVTVI